MPKRGEDRGQTVSRSDTIASVSEMEPGVWAEAIYLPVTLSSWGKLAKVKCLASGSMADEKQKIHLTGSLFYRNISLFKI